jgi:tRNA (guanine37-N1)-methyltransferase
VRLVRGLDEVLADLAERTGAEPTVVATTAKGPGTTTVGGVQRMLRRGPTLLLLGTGSGLAPQVVDRAHAVLRPVRFLAGYNHLSVRSAASIIVDRIVGDFA